MSIIGKPCIDCGVVLTPDNAIKSRHRICRGCQSRRVLAYRKRDPEKWKRLAKCEYERNKEKHAAKRAEKRVALRAEMIAAYGGKCSCCPEDGPEFMTIDHIENDGSWHRKNGESGGSWFYSKLKKLGWPKDKYQMLCMNCNWAKRRYGVCPHKMGAGRE